jgi:Cdc6-like AAA superfamily ATPase
MSTKAPATINGKPTPGTSLAERLALVERIFITYPRFDTLLSEIASCHQHALIAAEPPCLFVSGQTGAGKTTLIKTHMRAYPRQLTQTGTRVPVLFTTIPAPATVKGLAASLLTELGDPNATRGTTWSLTDRLKHYIRDCAVELIVLDELQHFVDRDQR